MKIILSCIVGNEAAVIERFIRSFAPLVDEICMVSAIGDAERDEAIEAARSISGELGVDFCSSVYVNQRKGFDHVDDFGAAREHAKNFVEYMGADSDDLIIWADCDDLLADGAAEEIRRVAEESPDTDLFLMPYHVRGDKQIVWRERMWRAGLECRWENAVHERLKFHQDVSYKVIEKGVIKHAPLESKTGSSERNKTILYSQLENAGNHHFYLAHEFWQRDEKKFKAHAEMAMKYLDIDDEQKYDLLLKLAQCTGEDHKARAGAAFALMPDRREALCFLSTVAIGEDDPKKALELARMAEKIPLPNKRYWTMDYEWYGWKLNELLNQCVRLNGGLVSSGDPTFTIVHATLGRPLQALAVREQWYSKAKHPERIQYVFGLHDTDTESMRYLRGFEHTVTDGNGAVINYDTAAGLAKGKVIIQAQDDCFPPEGWDEIILEKLKGDLTTPAFIAFSDGHRKDRITVSQVITKTYMEDRAGSDGNGFFARCYDSMYADTEVSFRAIRDAQLGKCRYIDARDHVIYHNHPYFDKSVPWDETYETENSPESYEKGKDLFDKRNPDFTPNLLQG